MNCTCHQTRKWCYLRGGTHEGRSRSRNSGLFPVRPRLEESESSVQDKDDLIELANEYLEQHDWVYPNGQQAVQQTVHPEERRQHH